MANAKLSALTSASFAGGDLIYLVQGGNARKATIGAQAAALLDDTGQTQALTTLGGTSVGRGVFRAATAAAALTAQGVSAFAQTYLDDTGGTTFRSTTGTNNATNLTTGTLDTGRAPLAYTTGMTFTGTSPVTLISTDAGAAAGPILTLYRNSASPAANDVAGQLLLQGKDSLGNTEDFAKISMIIDDPTSGSEDASIAFQAVVAGTLTSVLTLTAGGVTGSVVATQAQMETGTATDKIVSPGRQHFHPAHPKGVSRFNGTGTVAIVYDYNVDTITDNGTGNYTVNWDTDFSGTTYSAVAISNGAETSVGSSFGAGTTQVVTGNSSGTLTDFANINVWAIGDQA